MGMRHWSCTVVEQLFTDDANSVVSGANLTLFTNTFSGMADHETSVSIPVKSYEVSNLLVDSAQILLLGLLVTVILPVGCMIAGFVIWFRKTEEIIVKGVSYRYEKETKTDDRNAAGTGGAGGSIPGHPTV